MSEDSIPYGIPIPGVRILIPSGAGAPGFAGIVRCLRKLPDVYIAAGDSREYVYGSQLADAFEVVPSSQDEQIYVEKVVAMCKEHKIQVVLPITTRELGLLSKHKKNIEDSADCKVVVSELEGLTVANNKGLLYEFAWNHGFRVPGFAVISGRESFVLEAHGLGISHRMLCFKPVLGNGSRGFGRVIPDAGESGDWMEEKAGVLPMTLEEWRVRIPESLGEGQELLLSVYLTGAEYSVDMLCDRGKVIFCIPRSRDKMIGGISVAGTFVKNESLIAECCRLAELLELDGPVGMQWREDESGECYLLEINPRLQGTTSVLELAGLNLPMAAVKMALGLGNYKGRTGINDGIDFEWGRSFVRYWEECLLLDR